MGLENLIVWEEKKFNFEALYSFWKMKEKSEVSKKIGNICYHANVKPYEKEEIEMELKTNYKTSQSCSR